MSVIVSKRNLFTVPETGSSLFVSGTSTYDDLHPESHARTDTTYDYALAEEGGGRVQWAYQFPAASSPNRAEFMAVAAHNLHTRNLDVGWYNGSTLLATTASAAIRKRGGLPVGHLYEGANTALLNWGPRIDRDADNRAVRIGVVAAGWITTIPREVYAGFRPLAWNRETTFRPSLSRTGEFLGAAEETRGLRGTLTIDNVARSFIRGESWNEFHAWSGSGRPFFLWWRPEEYPHEVEYCWLRAPIRISNQRGGLVSIAMDLGAHAGLDP